MDRFRARESSRAISGKVGGWFGEAWDRVWALQVWGFHEAKFDSNAVRVRAPYVERIVEEAQKRAARLV